MKYKAQIFNRKLTALLSLFLIMGLNGCISEDLRVETKEPVINTGEDTMFGISVPGMKVPESRALDANKEKELSTVDVVIFSNVDNTILEHHIVPSSDVFSGVGTSDYVVKVKDILNTSNVTVAIISNASAEVSAAFTAISGGVSHIGKPKANFLLALKLGTTSKWNTNASGYRTIPMYGEIVVSGSISSSSLMVNMTRMLAKIDVYNSIAPANILSPANGDFELTAVHVVNRNTQGVIAPKWNEATGDILTSAPTSANLPTGFVPGTITWSSGNEQTYTLTSGQTSIESEIYLFESNGLYTPTENPAEHNPGVSSGLRLVLEGRWTSGGETNNYYYPVDFTYERNNVSGTTKYMPVLRNHRYAITITEASGKGYTSLGGAVSAYSVMSNLKTRVIYYDESDIKDMAFDGQYMLGVNSKEFLFEGKVRTLASTDNKLMIKADYPQGWTASVWDDLAGTSNTASTWLTLSSYSGNGNKNEVSLLMSANTTGVRTAYVHIQSGRLTYKVKVTQELRPMFIRITNSSGSEISELTFDYGVSSPISPQNFYVTWEGEDNLSITSAAGSPAFVYAGGSDQPAGTITGGTQTYAINSAAATAAEVSANPFLVKETVLTFTLTPSGGGTPLTKTIALRQGSYSIIPTVAAYYTLSSATPGTINVKANTPWAAELLVGGNAVTTLTSGQTGAGSPTTGENLQFTLAQGTLSPEFYMAQSQIRFYSPTGKTPDVVVDVNAYWLIWAYGVGFFPDNVSIGPTVFASTTYPIARYDYEGSNSNANAARLCTDKGAAYRLPNKTIADAWIASPVPVPAGGPYWIDEYGYRGGSFGTLVAGVQGQWYSSYDLYYTMNQSRTFTRYATTLTSSKTFSYSSQIGTTTTTCRSAAPWNYQMWLIFENVNYYVVGMGAGFTDTDWINTDVYAAPNAYVRCVKQVYPAVP